MQIRTFARRAGIVASATTLLSGIAFGGNANAVSAGGGAIVALSPAGLHNVEATLSYDATPFPGGSFVTFNCKAVAWIDPASTGIGTCTLMGVSAVGSPNNVPGAVSTAAGVVFVPDGTTPWACVEGHAQFAEKILGPLDVSTGTKCAPLKLVTLRTDVVRDITT